MGNVAVRDEILQCRDAGRSNGGGDGGGVPRGVLTFQINPQKGKWDYWWFDAAAAKTQMTTQRGHTNTRMWSKQGLREKSLVWHSVNVEAGEEDNSRENVEMSV